jgi:hypothetical protein
MVHRILQQGMSQKAVRWLFAVALVAVVLYVASLLAGWNWLGTQRVAGPPSAEQDAAENDYGAWGTTDLLRADDALPGTAAEGGLALGEPLGPMPEGLPGSYLTSEARVVRSTGAAVTPTPGPSEAPVTAGQADNGVEVAGSTALPTTTAPPPTANPSNTPLPQPTATTIPPTALPATNTPPPVIILPTLALPTLLSPPPTAAPPTEPPATPAPTSTTAPIIVLPTLPPLPLPTIVLPTLPPLPWPLP